MTRPHCLHLPQCKAQVALVTLRGDKTLAEFSEQFDLHPNQIVQWKQQAVESMAAVFDKDVGIPKSAKLGTPKPSRQLAVASVRILHVLRARGSAHLRARGSAHRQT